MRGMLIALTVIGAIWTGGLLWSLLGGLVLMPRSAVVGPAGPAVAAAPAPKPAGGAAPKPAAAPQAAMASNGTATGGPTVSDHAGHDAISHGTTVATGTKGNQLLEPRLVDGVKVFELTAGIARWEVAPGEFMEAYTYNGIVPGPLLRVTEGDRMRVVLKNELPEPTVIHFHGPFLPNSQDGVPDVTQPVVNPGETFSYEFDVKPFGTYIYHTHHNSLIQKSKGLYGVLQVDQQGVAPAYDREYFQVVGELGGFFVINGKAFPATEALEARIGERVRIHLLNLGEQTHPMHSHGFPTRIVATDGRPVEGPPLVKDTVNIGPGERYDLDFVADNPGAWVYHCHILSHVQNKGVEPGGMISVFKIVE